MANVKRTIEIVGKFGRHIKKARVKINLIMEELLTVGEINSKVRELENDFANILEAHNMNKRDIKIK